MKCFLILLSAWSICMLHADAQHDTIRLMNPSFEDTPKHSEGVRGWIDCGFPGETPPDVQPFESMATDVPWGQSNNIRAHDGHTYLGMVVRDNDTYERVAQRLSHPLHKDTCYRFSMYLCSSDDYMSLTHATNQIANYSEPAVINIRGGHYACDMGELLSTSTTIDHREWRRYDFVFQPSEDYEFIMIEAYYKSPALFLYNGNILLDNASDIIAFSCEISDPFLAMHQKEDTPDDAVVHTRDRSTRSSAPSTTSSSKQAGIAIPNTKSHTEIEAPKEIKLKTLQRNHIAIGQAIRIDYLHFAADTSSINQESYEVLNEIAYFLMQNPDIQIEIGGHTNGKPPDSYCNALSTARAKSVAQYLYDLGLSEDQVTYKGYGKRMPIASNQTHWGRQQNQRVEIKILNMNTN